MPYFFIIFIFLVSHFHLNADTLLLKDNFYRAKKGDYLVVSANRTDTLLHIYDKTDQVITIEEVAVPSSKRSVPSFSWKKWMSEGAPENSSWVIYDIDLNTGKMVRYYSFTKKGWFEISEADNFLFKLINLKFTKVPLASRRHIGLKPSSEADIKRVWHPQMIVDGKIVKGVVFDAWRAYWPKDTSELSGKLIEIYIPEENELYSSYFPYWLQVSGAIGKAKVRIIDSGSGLKSPKEDLGLEKPRI
jgi:hypothetical protein